jgi:hypothetical protein
MEAERYTACHLYTTWSLLTPAGAIKIKKSLIHKAKTKKAYAKLKAREPLVQNPRHEPPNPATPLEEPSQTLHPERQAMLDTSQEPTASPRKSFQPRTDGRRPRKPNYFKEIAHAEKQKAVVEARSAELDKRDKERKQRIAERERFRKAMAKAKSGGLNGQRKLGRESKVLLEKVKKLVGV